MTLKLMKHQLEDVKWMKNRKRVLDFSDAGCVSADTEFLTPTGWKRIDKYVKGDLVAQFEPNERTIEFVKPLDYIKRPCNRMIAIEPVRGTSQRLSHEHRVLYYRKDGSHGVMSAKEYMETLHRKSVSHFDAKFCTTFTVKNESSLAMSDIEIRLMVAVIADGHFPHARSRCTIRLKKKRKIERLSHILLTTGIDAKVRKCASQEGFVVFTFDAPRREKEFGDYWWAASQHQLEIIADELCHWDSSENKRSSNATRFSTLNENSANFAQYAFSAAKRPSTLSYAVRDRTDQLRGVSVEYNVHARNEDKFIGPGRATSVYEVVNPEGFKYCFEVPTSFLLLRRDGKIFATGNTGKTPKHITDFAERRRKKNFGCLLVLAPKSLLQSAWGADFRKFAPDMKVSIAWAENRDEAFAADADVYITNFKGALWLSKRPKKFFDKFDQIIIDECTALKHRTSGQSKAVAKIIKYFEWRRALSGTPTSNGICDLWHQVYLVDDGERLGKAFFAFQKATCTPEKEGPGVKWVDKPGVEPVIGALIEDITIRRRFEDCVDIPPNHRYAVPYTLTPSHRKLYEEMRANKFLETKGRKVTALNGAVLYFKLLQAASGAVYVDPDDDESDYTLLDPDRYDMIMDLVEARQHSIVFFNWRHQKDELVRVATARGIKFEMIDGTVTKKGERERIVQAYQRGEYQVLLANAQTIGHGLTLTKGTRTIFASPTPNLEHFLQGYKRIYRITQTEKTETIMVIAPDTIDEYVWEQCQKKDVRQSDLLAYVEN